MEVLEINSTINHGVFFRCVLCGTSLPLLQEGGVPIRTIHAVFSIT